MLKIFLTILFILNILNNVNAATVTSYLDYGNTSTVTGDNLQGNLNNIRNILNGDIDNANVNTKDGFRLYEVLGTLPNFGQQGRIIFYTIENSLNFDTGSQWIKAITITSPAQGDIVYYNGTQWVRLGAGTSGDILKTQGTGANPVWLTNLPVTNLNSGTSASATTYWRGDTTWSTPPTIPTNIQVFTSSGTWTKPDNISTVYVKAWGGGGGGGSSKQDAGGGGGGGGGYSEGLIAVTGNVTVTIGGGGAGGASNPVAGTDGTAGGNTTFAGTTTLTANGGAGGLKQGGGGGAGGTASNGTINITGQAGDNAPYEATASTRRGGGTGGGSPMGGSGSTNNAAVDAPNTAGSPGGGGSGGGRSATADYYNGGNGANGMVIVYY